MSMKSYLIMMAVRLMEMRRLLKPTGSLYLHCDPTASHYLKMLLDSIFGPKHFIDEIVWNYGTPSGGRAGGKKPIKTHETLLAYAKQYGKHVYNRQYTPYSEKYVTNWFRHEDEDGRRYRTRSRKGTIIRQYLDESPGVPLSNVWTDIMQLYGSAGWFPKKKDERVGYPTQKPLALLDRIIKASSNEGDAVLDPFAGCATACISADRLNRQWVGIDLSPMAAKLGQGTATRRARAVLRRAAPAGHPAAHRSGPTAELQNPPAHPLRPPGRHLRRLPGHVPVPQHDG